MNALMAFAISTPTYLSSSSTRSLATPVKSYPKNPKWISQLGPTQLSPWNGLKHLGISISGRPLKQERKRQCKGMVVYASLFGVGAPEALVIGVVALLVFGPKGLAEVARNLGKTLRAFQPTIRELQEVSREFKSTLEREIGLDEIESSARGTYSSKTTGSTPTSSSVPNPENSQIAVDPNGDSSPNRAYSSEEYLRTTEEQLRASAAQQQTQLSRPKESQFEQQTQPQADAVQEAAAAMPPQQKQESET